MISYLGSLVQFSPAAGRRGGLLSLSTLLRLPAALYEVGPALCAVPVFGSSAKVRTRLRLRFVPSPPEQLRQPGA